MMVGRSAASARGNGRADVGELPRRRIGAGIGTGDAAKIGVLERDGIGLDALVDHVVADLPQRVIVPQQDTSGWLSSAAVPSSLMVYWMP